MSMAIRKERVVPRKDTLWHQVRINKASYLLMAPYFILFFLFFLIHAQPPCKRPRPHIRYSSSHIRSENSLSVFSLSFLVASSISFCPKMALITAMPTMPVFSSSETFS